SVPAAMEMDDDFDSAFEHGKAVGWNACRAAMLQAGNSPVTPDGWKLVPVIAFPSQWAAGKKAFDSAGINKVDAVYKAMVEAAPQQEVKSAFEHGMQRYSGAMQKLSEGDK
ncbi:hypothetical protein VC855_24040, partial [Citrobacter freundii]|nr:hypothetical protein [Citrobacter freundii]MEB1037676.1 hypothetical protein [Citrobacter freundii]